MAARYSDRFFGPEGVAGQPSAPSTETIDLMAPADIGATARELPIGEPLHETPRWHAHAVARLALVGALLAGAGAGAYAWDKWRDHESEVLARSTVDITSTASLDSVSPDRDTLAMTLSLQNDSPYAVTITDIAPLDTRLSRSGDPWKPVALDVGEDVLRVLSFAIDCAEEVDPDLSTSTASALTAELRTVDGRLHRERLGLTGVGYYGGSLGQLLNDQCSFQEQRASYSSLYAETTQVVSDGDENAVTSVVVLSDPYSGSPSTSPVTVRATPSGSAFSTALSAGEPDVTGRRDTFLRWTVNDCTAALAATDSDMTVELQGSMPSEAALSTVSVWPTPTLAVALARLSERVCD